MSMLFNVGDRVKLKEDAPRHKFYNDYGFDGVWGQEFVIDRRKHSGGYITYLMVGLNWCREEWLESASLIRIGGE